MNEPQINNALWRAFVLGARVLANQSDHPLAQSEVDSLAQAVRQIAEGEITLEDPGEFAAGHPDCGTLPQELGHLLIRLNRDLAQRIYQGFLLTTELSD
jgi:hypothetical protein